MLSSETFRRLVRDQRGATAIEYGLAACGIAIAISAAVFVLGGDVSAIFGQVGSVVSGRHSVSESTPLTIIGFDPGSSDVESWSGGILAEIAGFGSVLQLDLGSNAYFADRENGRPGAETTTRVFELPTNTRTAILEFDMVFADSWDDEQARIYINGTEVGRGSFDWDEGVGPPPVLELPGGDGIQITASAPVASQNTGVSRFNAQGTDYAYKMRIQVEDPEAELSLGFGTTLNSKGQWDESLLVDNVRVSTIP